jgi:hypothetical protein
MQTEKEQPPALGIVEEIRQRLEKITPLEKLWTNPDGAWVLYGRPDSAVVCQRGDWNHRADESLANARLFASSARLLRAALSEIERLEKENHDLRRDLWLAR